MKNVTDNSRNVKGAVLKTLPPKYTNMICIININPIITIKAGFLEICANRLTLSVLEQKQLNTDAKINNAKNAVKR